MEYNHINDCWAEIRKAKTIEEVKDLFEKFPRWSGDWDIMVEDGQYVVYNTWFDEQFSDFDTDRETLDIEVEESAEEMEKETKIVLAIKGERAVYLFKREYDDFTEVKFVVGWTEGNPVVGDFVSGWASGKYFGTLEDALEYLNNCKY